MKQSLYIRDDKNPRIKNLDQNWVVYLHYHGEELVYVGSGQVHRAFQFIKRDPEHEKFLISEAIRCRGLSFVDLWFITDKYSEARWVESRIIAEHKPRFNNTLQKLTQQTIHDAMEEYEQTGKSYRKIAEELDIDIYYNNLRLHMISEFAANVYDLP